MASWVIGDVQGCLVSLLSLLERIRFHPHTDTLWLVGDLVNRGPDSLGVLRFLQGLGQHHRIVLGNHDLHLLARAEGVHLGLPGDTLESVLAAEDRNSLLTWLRHQPLLQHDPVTGFVMTHAGLPPAWDLPLALQLAREVETALQGEGRHAFLAGLYGNQPDRWDAALEGIDRLRCIVNCLTRMRFCDENGRLDFSEIPADGYVPWFKVKNRKNTGLKIVFGHWAALGGRTDTENVFAMDTGCVWGHSLSAMCLETGERLAVSCKSRL